MICGGCSLSRYQHYRAVPDRWSVAMSTTVAALIGLIFGFTTGAIIAGLTLMDRPWVVCVRLPEELHRRLSDEAADHMCSLKAEIINRLEASFDQPNGDQVVDAPRVWS
jgi:Arc-like DNA binding domain